MEDKLLGLLADKKALLTFLYKAIDESGKEKNGLVKLSESLTRDEPNLKPENMARCISSTMLTVAKQSHRLETLAIIALIQCQSSSFDSGVAEMLNKMGRGNEAVAAMFKSKLNGK